MQCGFGSLPPARSSVEAATTPSRCGVIGKRRTAQCRRERNEFSENIMNINKFEILDRICYTELVYERINKKLDSKFSKTEIEKMLFNIIKETPENFFQKIGKNIYVTNRARNIKMTINSNTYRIITVDKLNKTDMTNGLKVIGISIRTTNANNQSRQDLGKLWGQFFAENIAAKIPNKISSSILCIYTDYESDYTGKYTSIIGVPVSTLEEIPNGFIGREFKPDNFQKFVAKGEMTSAVVNTWIDIWQRDKELNRKYSYDFELYGEKSNNGDNSEVEIFVALKIGI
jgi:predicted transcriptional regulator YdeE